MFAKLFRKGTKQGDNDTIKQKAISASECPEMKLRPRKEGNKLAVVACGWFWGKNLARCCMQLSTTEALTLHSFLCLGPQLKFEKTRGVARCIVGYSGGKQPNPTYRRMKDHTESVLIEFDPTQIRYDELLVKWARMAYPYGKESTQYRNAIFFTNFDQQAIAEELVDKMQNQGREKGKKVYVDIEPVTKFYRAEKYHQSFMAKRGA